MSGLGRLVPSDQVVLQFRRQTGGDQRRRARNVPVNDDRDPQGSGSKHDTRQTRDLEPANFGEDRKWLGGIGRVDLDCPFNDRCFVL